MTNLMKIETEVTMTSLQLVEYVNFYRKEKAQEEGVAFPSKGHAKLEHDDFMKKVPLVLGEEAAPKFIGTASYVVNNASRSRPVYFFPKREACLMAMSYSYELQARVFDYMTELEAKLVKPQIILPDFTDPVEAATAWIEQYKEKQVALKQLELAAPKVQFVDDYVDTTGSKSFREVANIFKANERKFRKFLQEHGMMYQKKNKDWAAYSKFIDKKMLQHKIVVNQDTGRSYTLVYFTPLGIEYTAKKWNEYLVK